MNFRSRVGLGLTLSIALLGSCTKKKTDEEQSGLKVFKHLREDAERSLDPVGQFDSASTQMIQNLYDTLLEYHYLKRPYELTPNLLVEMPTKQKDNVTYTFKLRKGVYFHDNACFPEGKGREMKADDVIYTFKRFADANANKLSYSLIKGYIEGMDEFREATLKAGSKTDYEKMDISGLKKVDDYTITIKYTSDNPLALYPLAFKGMSIVPREAVEKYGKDFNKNPVGTGPFYMKTYSRRGTHVLYKHKTYHMTYPTEGMPGDKEKGMLADAGKKMPFVDVVELPLIEETQPAMLKFKKGQLYWIAMNKDEFSNIAFKDKGGTFHLKDEWKDKYKIYDAPDTATWYMRFNMNDPVVGKNKALRQAMALAIDTSGYVDLMYNGRGIPAQSIVPVPISGSAKYIGSTWYKQDKELAKKKLAEAGFPGGKGAPTILIEYRNTNKDSRQQFEYFRNQWQEIGLTVKANFQTFSNFLQRTDAGNYQVADSGWKADYPDAENFYQLLFSKNKAPGPNNGNYDNPEYDALYEKIRHLENGPERNEIFKKLNAIIKEDVPVLLIFNPIAVGLYHKDVSNMRRNLIEEYPYKYLNLK